ncbi:MAG: hypothetical protein ABEJ28_04600 [Salinigranum sp.]
MGLDRSNDPTEEDDSRRWSDEEGAYVTDFEEEYASADDGSSLYDESEGFVADEVETDAEHRYGAGYRATDADDPDDVDDGVIEGYAEDEDVDDYDGDAEYGDGGGDTGLDEILEYALMVSGLIMIVIPEPLSTTLGFFVFALGAVWWFLDWVTSAG